MMNSTEQEYLRGLLLDCEQQQQYYLTMAFIIMIFSWFWYFALRKVGTLITALILSVALWYYPWRYFQRAKLLRLDLANQQKKTITTIINKKNISSINRLQPYYYIYTDEECFEVDEVVYSNVEVSQEFTISYAIHSKTILNIRPSHSTS